MKKIVKRAFALLLCAIMLVGYIPVIPQTATAVTVAPTEARKNLLTADKHNFSFESTVSGTNAPKGWTLLQSTKPAWIDYGVTSNGNGGSALRFKVSEENRPASIATCGIYSEVLDVESLQGKEIYIQADVKNAMATDPSFNIFTYFYTNADAPTGYGSTVSSYSGGFGPSDYLIADKADGNWYTVAKCSRESTNITVPEGAKYLRVFFYVTSARPCEFFVDNITIKTVCTEHTYEKGYASVCTYSVNACQTTYFKRCDNCDYFRTIASAGITNGTVGGPSNHKLKHVPQKDATNTALGHTEYWTCSRCNLWFADKNAAFQIIDKDSITIGKKYENLLADFNPGFEGEVGEDGIPASWIKYNQASEEAFSVSEEQKTEGKKALKITSGSHMGGPRGLQSAYIKVPHVDKLSIIFDLKGEIDVLVYMYFYDGNKSIIPNVEGEPAWFAGSPRSGWTQVNQVYTVPEGAWYAQIMFYATPNSEGIAYVDDVVLKEYQKSDEPPVPTELFESFEGDYNKKTGLPWGWSFYTEATKPTADKIWAEYLNVKGKKPKNAPSAAVDGKFVFRLSQVKDDEKIRGVLSSSIDVSKMKGLMVSVDLYGPSGIQVYTMYYDAANQCPENSQWRIWTSDSFGDGEWGQVNMETPVPEGAKYARVLIVKTYSNDLYIGDSYIDKVTMKETELPPVAAPAPQPDKEVKHDWTIAVESHPRVYFNEAELRRIKKWTISDSETSVGYSGKQAYDELIADAEKYMKEKEYHLKFTNFSDTMQLTPVLEDMSCNPNFELAPAPGYAIPYPYMTRITADIEERVQTLSFAYVLSGNKAYGERAVQYATDLCKWKYWVGEFETIQYAIANGENGEYCAQPTGYCVTAVATAYDMCFDLLTKADKKLMENALIEKGLEPMYNTCYKRMRRGRDQDHMASTYIGACAIINKDNIDKVGKYLDRVVQYNDWIFDWYDLGHNEGYSYAENGIEQLYEGMAVLERVTGYKGNLEHHFATDTLPAWIKGFVEPYGGTMVGYSDSPYEDYFLITLSIMAQLNKDQAAGYCIHLAQGADRAFDKLIYTNISDDFIMQPDDDYMNVTVVEQMGVGSLRTGWGKMDKMLAMISDDYGVDHAHYEANSIFLAMGGQWIIRDPGYGSIQLGVPKTYFDIQYSSNTIVVDGKAQSVKGAGKISEIVNSELYGHILGQAPKAYGKYDGVTLVDKFDRNTIMMNHDSESYYIVIDDLASSQKRVFSWNMNHAKFSRMELDGKVFNPEKVTSGNHLALIDEGKVLHYQFVGEKLDFSQEFFKKSGESFGPLFRASSKSTKEHQFMTVLSIDPEYEGITTIDATADMTARSSNLKHNDPNGWSWSSSNDLGMVIALPMGEMYGLNMFRAQKIGDWMSFAFMVEEAGDYYVSLLLGQWSDYAGKWQIYLDDKPIGDLYSAKSNKNSATTYKLSDELMHVSAGRHTVKLELVADPETEDLEWGTLVSMGQVFLEKADAGLGQGNTQVLESYDDKNVLGATIRYGNLLNDVVLFNRGKGTMTAGGIASDGKQANVMGVYEGDITEGFNVIGGTTLSFNDATLFKADGAMNMSVDYRYGKIPVQNIEMTDLELMEFEEKVDISKPITTLTTTAKADRKVSVLAAADAPYTVMIVTGEGLEREETVLESSVVDGMVTFTVPKGTHTIEILGTHNCVFDQHATRIPNIKTWANCTEGNVYYVSCYCGANGTETFTVGEAKGHKLVALEAKEPTETENGNIACWQCKVCKAYFADAEGKKELKESDVILLSFKQEQDMAEQAQQRQIILIVCIVVGVLLLAATATLLILRFKFGFFTKKKSEEKEEETKLGEDLTTEATPVETPTEAIEDAPAEEESKADEATE